MYKGKGQSKFIHHLQDFVQYLCISRNAMVLGKHNIVCSEKSARECHRKLSTLSIQMLMSVAPTGFLEIHPSQ